MLSDIGRHLVVNVGGFRRPYGLAQNIPDTVGEVVRGKFRISVTGTGALQQPADEHLSQLGRPR